MSTLLANAPAGTITCAPYGPDTVPPDGPIPAGAGAGAGAGAAAAPSSLPQPERPHNAEAIAIKQVMREDWSRMGVSDGLGRPAASPKAMGGEVTDRERIRKLTRSQGMR
jgi:hypothetical protein